MMTGSKIRQIFLDYFKENDHTLVRSSSLVPSDDPSLLFTNAGMVQFKRLFTGEEKRAYSKAVSSQKCVRAGGKHNDLENVGYTARHHTFFEMLGNFSFGDYFKEKAIYLAWDLLTNIYGLPEEKLWVSIYLDDDEAFEIWNKKIGVPAERIVRLGEEDNFWLMGDTGPCGPCSEIHIDREIPCSLNNPDCGVDCDCDRFLEIWNLVFMQFFKSEDGSLTPLPNPSIDTGMGLERIASVIQGVDTNYDTDLFKPIMDKVAEMASLKDSSSKEDEVAMKVIADHSRAACFLVGDGVLPSNEGRGYVLRRILRRAIRYGRNIGLNRPFLKESVQVVFEIMEDAYPELKTQKSFIISVIENEELRFSETLDNGLKLLDENLLELKKENRKQISGDLIFRLYDTYGFPVDILKDITKDSDFKLDMEGFEKLMEDRRKMSRTKLKFDSTKEAYLSLSRAGVQSTFTGYKQGEDTAKVLLIVKDDKVCESLDKADHFEIITDKTPFYAESGGQAGDKGYIEGENFKAEVLATVKDPTGLIIHQCKFISGRISSSDTVKMLVDREKRTAAARNHTATHLLHAALKDILGDHVKQAGSMLNSERLRFDFTHFSGIDREVLKKVEAWVNDKIRKNLPVSSEIMSADEAFKSGAVALFEEKYGDSVRVISLSSYSKEFCGGTHVESTGDIGLFTIVSEGSVASGVRRIEALTAGAALEHMQEQADIVLNLTSFLKDKPETLVKRVENLVLDLRKQEKDIENMKLKIAEISTGDISEGAIEIEGVSILAKKVMVDNPASLRDLADRIKDKLGSAVILLGTESAGKVLLVSLVTKDLTKRFHAGKIVKRAAELVGGGGGGRPDMAQAGGSLPEKLDEALKDFLSNTQEVFK